MPPTSTQCITFPSSIVILGAGRLGTALSLSLIQQGQPLCCLWNRRPPSQKGDDIPYFIGSIPPKICQQADLLLLTVSDHAISEIVDKLCLEKLVSSGQVVLHCSGLFHSEILEPLQEVGCEIGSMHPLQPIASAETTQQLFTGVAVGIEGSPIAQQAARKLTQELGGQPFSLEGIDKTLYHAAAVFASNYVVGLAHVAVQLMHQAGLHDAPLDLLLPLLQRAVDNLGATGLPDALTGPISRGDASTIAQHINALKSDCPEYIDLYLALAQATLPLAQAQHQGKRSAQSTLAPLLSLLQSLEH